MKKFILFAVFSVPILGYSQYHYGFLKEHFFARQQNARSEAMGRSYTAMHGDLQTVYANPAGLATLRGIELSGSVTPPTYYFTTGNYHTLALGFGINRYVQIALSQFQFNGGTSELPGFVAMPFSKRTTLTVSSQPFNNWHVGLNIHRLVFQHEWLPEANTLYVDLGLQKRWKWAGKRLWSQEFVAGGSVSNASGSHLDLIQNNHSEPNDLPVIAKAAFMYKYGRNLGWGSDSLQTFAFLIHTEYQDILNGAYENALRAGTELTLLDMLMLRAGYYFETQYDYGYPQFNVSKLEGITYGLGVKLPLHQLTGIPFSAQLDYCSLPQPSFSKISVTQVQDFTTWNLKLNWYFRTGS